VQATPPVVLAVHDAGLVGMQPQPPALRQPRRDRLQHSMRLGFAATVDHHVIAVPFEPDGREHPPYPGVERVVHEQVRQQGRDRRALWAAPIPGDHSAVLPLLRRSEPPLHIQQDPPLVGVVCYRLEDQAVIKVVEEPLDVQIDHPVSPPATLPAPPDRVQRATARPVPVGVGVEDLLHLRLQTHGHHRLRDPVRDRRHPEDPDPAPSRLGNLHYPHRRREVATRREPVPQLVEVSLQVHLELLDRLAVDPSRTLVGLDPAIGLKDHVLRNLERLRSAHLAPPGSAG
jgi:hypothetical protein